MIQWTALLILPFYVYPSKNISHIMISRIKSRLKLISFNRLPAKQNYEASKQLTDTRFKRLVGVQRTTFEEMLAVLKTAYQLKHAKGGRKPK
ncbi:hypothetical protein V2O57_04945, partial [Streptococcus pneumoniae]|nr:hypothetical protein [Streptococcus pneumoniae]